MKREANIRNVFSRKTLCILLMLLVGISYTAGGAMADNCPGGPGCLKCAARPHAHIPGVQPNIGDPGCQPAGQNGSCGFEVGRHPVKFDRIASTAGFGSFQHAGIFIAASDYLDQANLYRFAISPFQYPDPGELVPVYLLNKSLLC